jgi:hypothetical protein
VVPPLLPTTVQGFVLGFTLLPMATCAQTVVEPFFGGFTDAEPNTMVTPAGRFDADKPTSFANPFFDVTVQDTVPALPRGRVTSAGSQSIA